MEEKRIGFVGLGNMGRPMVEQLLQAGCEVHAFDRSEPALRQAEKSGAVAAGSLAEVATGVSVIVTMLPEGAHVRDVYFGRSGGGLIDVAGKGTLLIDSSTIDVGTSKEVGKATLAAGLEMVDAPVTGGVMAARAGKLNFMVGGEEASFERAKPILAIMGQRILYAGEQGSGIGVKICNNMALGISMIAAAEMLMMAKRLGLDLKRTFDIVSGSSGGNWALANYSPIPGLIDGVPANNAYKPGFAAGMMRKDLRLAQDAARSVDACTPLGAHALSIFSHFCDTGDAQTDYSGISKLIGGDAWDYPFAPQEGAQKQEEGD